MKALLKDFEWNAPPTYLEDHGVSISSEMLENIRNGKKSEIARAEHAVEYERSWDEAEAKETACPEGSWWHLFKERVSSSWEAVQSYREARVCEATMADWHGKPAALGLSQADQIMDVMARSPKLRGEMMLVIFLLLFPWVLFA